MTQQKDQKLVQVQQQCIVYFCIKIFFKSGFVWLIWPLECQILMILTMTKYHENLLRDCPTSLLFTVKFLSSLETKKVLKIQNETFLRITRYQYKNVCPSIRRSVSPLRLLIFGEVFRSKYWLLFIDVQFCECVCNFFLIRCDEALR